MTKMDKKIQTKVIIGKGKKKLYEEVCFKFPEDEKLFVVEDVKTSVDVYHAEVVDDDTVIINYYLLKNIVYKTAEEVKEKDCHCKESITVKGDIRHITKKIRFGGFIDVEVEEGEKIKKGDIVEILEAKVLGDVEKPLSPVEILDKDGKPTGLFEYCELLEKLVIYIKLKVVRYEHLIIDAKEEHDHKC